MKKIVLSISSLVISITISLLVACNPAVNAQKSQGQVYNRSNISSHLNSTKQDSLTMRKNMNVKDLNFDATLLKQHPSFIKTITERVNSSESICFEIACYQAIHNKIAKDIETFLAKIVK